MFRIKDTSPVVVSGLFWEPFEAANAITALIRSGFAEYDVDALGVLSGRAPDVRNVLYAMGIAREDAIFYNECFADGAVLLIVRTKPVRKAKIALKVLKQHGGIFAPTAAAPSVAAEQEVFL